jgi:hypothetical protein
MSDDDFGFAPPPFRPDDALAQIRRALRDLKLTERGPGFDLRGKRVLEVEPAAAAEAITVRLARKLALTPQWDALVVRSTTEQRRLLDEVKKRLARWESEE